MTFGYMSSKITSLIFGEYSRKEVLNMDPLVKAIKSNKAHLVMSTSYELKASPFYSGATRIWLMREH